MITSCTGKTQIVGCLAISVIALAILHGCAEETVSTGETDSWQDTPSHYEQPDRDIPDSAQDEAPISRHEEPASVTTPEPPEQTSSPEDVTDQPVPEEAMTSDRGDPASTDQDGGTGVDAAEADGGTGGEDVGAAGDGDQASTGQDGGTVPETAQADGGIAATGDRLVPAEESADDASDEERLRHMLAMLEPGGPAETEEAGTSPSPPPNGPPPDHGAELTEGQEAPTDDVTEPDGPGGGTIDVPELPTPPPLPPAEDVSSVEGTVVPEDVGSADEMITGVWQQVGGGGAADFLPGGYVDSEFTFLADGTVRIRRTFNENGDIVMTWRVSYEWNEGQTELTIGSDPDTRPTPASLRGFTIRESNVQATPAVQDFPCVLKCVRSDDGQVRLADKTYAPSE